MGASSTVPAARRALTVLRRLAARGPSPASAIVRDTGLPRSTVYHLLSVLTEEGFATYLPEERRWALGLGALEMGWAYTRQAPLARMAAPIAARLADRTGHSTQVAVLDSRDVLYVATERAPGAPHLVSRIDVRLPAALTASGQAILAHLPPVQVHALYPAPFALASRTGAGPRTPAELSAVLERVRERGYAVEDGEVTPGFASFGAAALDHLGLPAAGIAVTFPSEQVPRSERRTLVGPVVQAARDLTRRLSPTR